MHRSMLAFAIIAIVIVAILMDEQLGAVLLAGGLLYFAAELWKQGGSGAEGFTSAPEPFQTSPASRVSAPRESTPETFGIGYPPWAQHYYPPVETYLGAISVPRYAHSGTDGWRDGDSRQFGSYRDRHRRDNRCVPFGNPFVTNRTFAPSGAPACFDDEANDEEFDADEKIVYQARSRNDPLRATIGSMNRVSDVDHFVREELEEEEDRPWWGRHEI